jgi:hypothetical protein
MSKTKGGIELGSLVRSHTPTKPTEIRAGGIKPAAIADAKLDRSAPAGSDPKSTPTALCAATIYFQQCPEEDRHQREGSQWVGY